MQQGVGSCVVFSDSGPSKKDYRLFNIPNEIVGVIWDFSDLIREYKIDLKEMHRIVKNSIFTYDREIWNWNTEKSLLKKIGVYGSEVFYDDFQKIWKLEVE